MKFLITNKNIFNTQDAHKLDISDEFKGAINATKGNENKIRVVLNKADSINGQQLTRVYGALMWSLGRVFSHPEVPRVYLGSFWDQPLQHRDLETLLVSEKRDLLADLRDLPRNSIIRRINEVIRRARMAKTHALIIGHFKKEMPGFFGKTKQQNALLDNIEEEFAKVQMKNQLPKGDFPDPVHFREHLAQFKIDKLQKYDKKLMEKLDDVFSSNLGLDRNIA